MFRVPLLIACLSLLVACKNDNPAENSLPAITGTPPASPTEPGPVSAPVSSAVSFSWNERPAFGGPVDDLAHRENAVFATESGNLWRFDLENLRWERLETRAHDLVTTADGHTYTNTGYRLGTGEHAWEQLDFDGQLWLGEDGRTLLRKGEDNGVLVSYDDGGTWQQLPPAPALYFSLAQFRGDLYAAVSGARDSDKQGVWRLKSGASSWQRVSRGDLFPRDLVTFHNDVLLSISSSRVYWSNDGEDWREASPGGRVLSYLSVAGTGSDGAPLLGDWNQVYAFTQDGELVPRIDIPGSAHVTRVEMLDDGHSLVGSVTGLWLVSKDGKQEAQLAGIPGDRISRIFHFHDGTFASVNSGPGYAHLAQFDDTTNAWIKKTLQAFHILDIAELPAGDKLLGTAWAYESGHGSLFRWRKDGAIDQIFNTREIVSVVALENGDWLIATDRSMDGDDYLVLHSTDEGETWSESRRDTEGPQTLVSNCGTTYAAGAAGLHAYDAARSEWTRLASADFEFVGAAADDRQMLLYSQSRLWKRESCNETFEPVPLPGKTKLVHVAQDRNGGIWAATKAGGIYLAPGENEWKWFSEELPEGGLRHVSVDTNGTVWVRVPGKGIFSGDRIR